MLGTTAFSTRTEFSVTTDGPEGHHNIFNMNTSLLGGSSRPPLD
jgi:hypothetical protein